MKMILVTLTTIFFVNIYLSIYHKREINAWLIR